MKVVRSWSKPDGIPDLIARKQVDWSVLQEGATIPLEFIEDFQSANNDVRIERGQSQPIILVHNGTDYGAVLRNVNRQVASDTLQILWSRGREFRDLLAQVFAFSFNYIEEERAARVNETRAVEVPEDKAEYIEFYQTGQPFKYRVEFVSRPSDDVLARFKKYVSSSALQFSYKLVLLRSMLPAVDSDGSVDVDVIVQSFRDYYLQRIDKGLRPDDEGAVVNSIKSMSSGELRRHILENPFAAYSKAGWMQRSDNRLGFAPELWATMSLAEREELWKIVNDRLGAYMEDIDTRIGNGNLRRVSDKEMLGRVQERIAAQGFQYSLFDLANFYLSLRTKPFVILAGISGTGKSRLPRLFAEAISGQWHQISVRPDWNDGSDLLGYVDLTGKFRPGELTNIIRESSSSPDTPYLVVLDEMNLARVEYYMSDLLSKMETRELKDGQVQSSTLFSAAHFRDEEDRALYQGLNLPNNLYLVGTVNMDETTHPFSKKVLDRANTIEFSHVDLKGYAVSAATIPAPVRLNNNQMCGKFVRLADALAVDALFVDSIVDKLVAINEMLCKANLQVGYRVRDEVVIYMLHNRQLDLLPGDVAFDYQLSQKILPRIQGSSLPVRRLLVELLNYCGGIDLSGANDDLLDRLQEYEDSPELAPYPRSAAKLTTMLRRFEEDGFTSYWI